MTDIGTRTPSWLVQVCSLATQSWPTVVRPGGTRGVAVTCRPTARNTCTSWVQPSSANTTPGTSGVASKNVGAPAKGNGTCSAAPGAAPWRRRYSSAVDPERSV